jgi:hypothetical protein
MVVAMPPPLLLLQDISLTFGVTPQLAPAGELEARLQFRSLMPSIAMVLCHPSHVRPNGGGIRAVVDLRNDAWAVAADRHQQHLSCAGRVHPRHEDFARIGASAPWPSLLTVCRRFVSATRACIDPDCLASAQTSTRPILDYGIRVLAKSIASLMRARSSWRSPSRPRIHATM